MTMVGTGILGPGAAEFFDVVLKGNHTYQIYVDPSEPGVDFDLRIYDENGNLIAQDIRTTADAYCALTPKWTGPFRLVVNSERGLSSFRILVQE
jgi:hypothetical protein